MRALARVSLLTMGLGLVVACGEPSERGEDSEHAQELGKVSLSLMATGPDGATYTMPWGSQLLIRRAGEEDIVTTLRLEEPVPELTFAIEAGDYVGTLHQLVNEQGEIILHRETADSYEPVSAELVSDNPVAFTITPGGTTTLALRFRLATLGDVVFSTGTLDVELGLEDSTTPEQGRGFEGVGTCKLGDASAPPSSMNPILSALRNLPDGMPVTMRYELSRSGEWTLSPGQICAPVLARSVGVDEPFALALLFNEASGGTGTICFRDADEGGSVAVSITRVGVPNSPELWPELPASTRTTFGFYGVPAEPLVEGGTLHLSRLEDALTIPATGVSITVQDANTPSGGATSIWTYLDGSVTLEARL